MTHSPKHQRRREAPFPLWLEAILVALFFMNVGIWTYLVVWWSQEWWCAHPLLDAACVRNW